MNSLRFLLPILLLLASFLVGCDGLRARLGSDASSKSTGASQTSNNPDTAIVAELRYPQSELQLKAGITLENFGPTQSGNAGWFTISPELPRGLSFNSLDGSISGTPIALSAAVTYLVHYVGDKETKNTTLVISIVPEFAEQDCYGTSQIVLRQGVTGEVVKPQKGFEYFSRYSVAPTLPAGLQIDPLSGGISGEPTESLNATSFVVSADGAFQGRCEFSLIILPKPPVNLAYGKNTFAFTPHFRSSTAAPSWQDGANVNFTVTPDLPSGLIINSSTGEISGKPQAVGASKTYTVTASNDGGSASTSVVVSVVDEQLDLENISISTNTLPNAAGGASAQIIGDYVYLIGGQAAAQPWLNDGRTRHVQRASLSNPEVFTDLGAVLPANIAWHNTQQIGDYVYIFGSVYGPKTKVLRAHKSDLTVWTEVGTMPVEVYNTRSIVTNSDVYIFGANEGSSIVYKAALSDLNSWSAVVDSGFIGVSVNFRVDNDYYFVAPTKVSKSSVENVAQLTPQTAPTLAGFEVNNGLQVIVGSRAYIVGNWMSQKIFSASVANLSDWREEAQTLPILSWGMHHGLRIGNTYYIFGGINSGYTGHSQITKIPIIAVTPP